MEFTDLQYDTLHAKIMEAPGITKQHDSELMMEEVSAGSMFMKFMSDGGRTDRENGVMLDEYLTSKGITHEYFQERKFVVANEDLFNLFLK